MRRILLLAFCFPCIFASREQPFPGIDGTWARKTLSTLSLDEKIGQLFVIAAVSDEQLSAEFMQESVYTMDQAYVETCIERFHVGGIIFAGKGTIEKQITITNRYQSLSPVPLLIAQDLEWGLTMRLVDGMRFPRAMTLGALRNEELIYDMSSEIARQAKLLGVHMVLAPVVDVNNNRANPVIADRSFGQDPHAVARKGILFMRGLQEHGIIACAKHFPGHGNTHIDSHYGLPHIDAPLAELQATELFPFKELIHEGVSAVLTAHLDVPALTHSRTHQPTSLSYEVVTKVLKEQLGFSGLVVTDGLGMTAVAHHRQPGMPELEAFLAGSDIILMPVDIAQAHALIKQAIVEGIISEQELDSRVIKILQAKEWAFAHNPVVNQRYEPTLWHTPQAYALKQQLYHEAITITRNVDGILPLQTRDNTKYSLVQIGDKPNTPFAVTLRRILSCEYHYIPAQATSLTYQLTQHNLSDAETIIVALFDMNKFAHNNFGMSQETVALIHDLHDKNKTIILVLFGSPYSTSLFGDIPAITVAYENDADAQIGAANIIAGLHTAHGIVPVS